MSIKKFLEAERKVEAASTLHRRDGTIAELRAERKHLLAYIEKLKERIDIFHAASRPLTPTAIRARKKKKSKGEAVAIVCANDWHVGETVKPGSVNGMNRYNPEEAQERAELYFLNTIKVINTLRSASEINTLVFAILGDMISGYIHEELLESNSMSPSEEIFFARKLLCDGLSHWLKCGDFEKIIIPCHVGNHARTTHKKRHGTMTQNSFEWMLYKILEADFKNDPRVEFRIAEGYMSYVDIYGVNVRFHHGDEVNGGDGVGGLAIPLLRKIGKWNRNNNAHLDVLGHFHQSHDFQNAVTSGSLIGPSAYSLDNGYAFEPPQQSLILIDSEYRRKKMTTPIHCVSPQWLKKYRWIK